MNPTNGKGDAPRKGSDNQKYAENYERIFGRKNKQPVEKTRASKGLRPF
jgi:hypothetical protein